jgi:hypothetical protein
MTNVSAITDNLINTAAATADLTDALFNFQAAIGQDDGGVAALVFSGDWAREWPRASLARRREMMDKYVELERHYAPVQAAEMPQSKADMEARVSLLAGEMDGNDAENARLQDEISRLHAQADSDPPPADREALLAQANALADEMDDNDEENAAMQKEIDDLGAQIEAIEESEDAAPRA